jgi:2-haloacid dehalogenase
MTIRAVVFDIGNVLLEWNPERFYDRVLGPDRRRAFFAESGVEEMNLRVDRGHPFAETVFAHADAVPAWRDEIRMWHDNWIEMASPAIDQSVRLMGALQARGVPVYSLTNFGVESYEVAAGHYPFLKAFDRDFISGHMRVIKPDARIYEMLEETTGLAGDALIFTDDRPENIEAAAARGWRTHLFGGPQGWADRLVEEGLLTLEEAQ